GMSKQEIAALEQGAKMTNIAPQIWMSTDGTRRYLITMLKLGQAPPDPENAADQLREFNKANLNQRGKILGEDAGTIGGRNTKWLRVKFNNGKSGMTCYAIFGDRLLEISVLDDSDVALTDANVKKFIDSFTASTGSSPSPEKGKTPGRGR